MREERRKQRRTYEGRRPLPVFDAWGSFGGISENNLRGRVLSVLWFVVFITSLPGIFLVDDSMHLQASRISNSGLVALGAFCVFLGPALRLWHTNWDDLDKKWLHIPYSAWLHIALLIAVLEIALLNFNSSTLAFHFNYLFVLGYVAYFYSFRTTAYYLFICLFALTLPVILENSFPGIGIVTYINSVLAITLVALLIAWQQVRLRNSNRRLRTLNALVRELTSAFTPAEKHQVFINNMRKVFHPKIQIIWGNVLRPQGGRRKEKEIILDAVPEASRIDLMQVFGEKKLSKRMPWALLFKRSRLLREGATQMPIVDDVLEQLACNQVMSVPLQTGPDRPPLGLAWLGNETSYGFTREDFVYFQACVKEYAHSLEIYNSERQAMRAEDELGRLQEVADVLQENLLPKGDYSTDSLEVGYAYYAATTRSSIGGDFYDFLMSNLERHGLGIVIGDTVGHGLGAAKLTALIKYTLRTLVDLEYPLDRVLAEANHVVNLQAAEHVESPLATIFSTICYAYYAENDSSLHLSNSGHYLPLVYHPDLGVVRPPIGFHRPPLGAYDGMSLEHIGRVTEIRMTPGSLICFYTDGLVEAKNAEKQEFSVNGIADALTDLRRRDTSAISRGIMKRVKSFSGNNLSDDATVIVLRARPHAGNKEMIIAETLHVRDSGNGDAAEIDEFYRKTLRTYLNEERCRVALSALDDGSVVLPSADDVTNITFEYNLCAGTHRISSTTRGTSADADADVPLRP